MSSTPIRSHEVPHGQVQDPQDFVDSLTCAFDGLHAFIHTAREWTLPEIIDGVTVNPSGGKPYAFQATWQYARPKEFHQSLVDMVRMMFDPHPPGTLMLNSNFGLMLEGIPARPFRLAYLSGISEPGETVAEFKARVIDGCCSEFGLDQHGPCPLFVVICAGQGSTVALSRGCSQLFNAGYSIEGVLRMLGAACRDDDDPASPAGPGCHLGYSIDPALGDRLRISMWRFVLAQTLQ